VDTAATNGIFPVAIASETKYCGIDPQTKMNLSHYVLVLKRKYRISNKECRISIGIKDDRLKVFPSAVQHSLFDIRYSSLSFDVHLLNSSKMKIPILSS